MLLFLLAYIPVTRGDATGGREAVFITAFETRRTEVRCPTRFFPYCHSLLPSFAGKTRDSLQLLLTRLSLLLVVVVVVATPCCRAVVGFVLGLLLLLLMMKIMLLLLLLLLLFFA